MVSEVLFGSPNVFFHPCVGGGISAHGYHPPEFLGSPVEGLEQRFLSRKCKESLPLPVPNAKKRHRTMLIL